MRRTLLAGSFPEKALAPLPPGRLAEQQSETAMRSAAVAQKLMTLCAPLSSIPRQEGGGFAPVQAGRVTFADLQ